MFDQFSFQPVPVGTNCLGHQLHGSFVALQLRQDLPRGKFWMKTQKFCTLEEPTRYKQIQWYLRSQRSPLLTALDIQNAYV